MVPDPRVYLAAERTLLAWVRTGLTIMGFGFVVARFGLFLRIMALQYPAGAGSRSPFSPFSNLVGVALVLLASCVLFVAAMQHRTFVRTLPAADIPASRPSAFAFAVATALGILGLALTLYLVFS